MPRHVSSGLRSSYTGCNGFGMTLDQYLETSGVTAAELGAKCDPPISEATISRIRRGRQNVTIDMMRRIIAASGDKVTASGLLAAREPDQEAA